MAIKAKPIKRALISVHNKTGLVSLCSALVNDFGIEIISTGGTATVTPEKDYSFDAGGAFVSRCAQTALEAHSNELHDFKCVRKPE